MPLATLGCFGSLVSDLTPLRDLKLRELSLSNTPLRDLSPLRGMPVKKLSLHAMQLPDHNVLKVFEGGQPVKLYRLGAEYGYFPASIKPYIRVPSGHPEGFHEALANLHLSLQLAIRAKLGESVPTPFEHPGIVDGAAGMAFIEAAVASSKQGGEWVEVAGVS